MGEPSPSLDTCGTWCFDRREISGSLGDLGTLLPIAVGMILINGLDGTAVFLLVGLYYILSGAYFRITMPVQPMKVIGAYAIAQALSPAQITVAGFWMGAFLVLLALTGSMKIIGRIVPRSTVRGVQLATGALLIMKGVQLILGESSIQKAQGAAEPFLSYSHLGPVPVGILLGVGAVILILLLLNNKFAPAALVVVLAGVMAGLSLGAWRGLAGFELGFHLPKWMPFGWPDPDSLVLVLTMLALPQLPMTVGNAIIAQADVSREYFGDRAKRCTLRALALSMGIANLVVAFFGGMPMCHGAGGLAAHYRFGARTAGSNLMIGGVFLLVGLFVGDQAVALFSLLPLAVLGALLVFAGAQLAMMILDVNDRRDLFVVILMLGLSLTTNLAIGFGAGIAIAYLLRLKRFEV
jgi:sulfate permease, SulP family